MDRADEFIETFRRDPNDASHLINIKSLYRQAKLAAQLSLALMYVSAFILILTPLPDDNLLVLALFGILTLILLISGLGMIVFYLDGNGYELSNEDLVCHEFAEAVNEYLSDPPNYESWKNHLLNVKTLVNHHGANVFSKYRSGKVITYIDRVEKTDADNVTKSTFESFYQAVLIDMLDERTDDFNGIIEGLENETNAEQGRLWVFLKSVENLYTRWRINTLGPVLGTLVLGIGTYFLVDEGLGTLITVSLLSAIGILRGREK